MIKSMGDFDFTSKHKNPGFSPQIRTLFFPLENSSNAMGYGCLPATPGWCKNRSITESEGTRKIVLVSIPGFHQPGQPPWWEEWGKFSPSPRRKLSESTVARCTRSDLQIAWLSPIEMLGSHQEKAP